MNSSDVYPVRKRDMAIGNCEIRQKDEKMTHRIWWHEHQASRSKRKCESKGSRVSLWKRSHRRSRVGASSFCLLYDACLIEFLSGTTSGLSPTSTTNVRNDDNHWGLLWANPPLSVLPVYSLWSSEQLWGGLCHSSEEETGSGKWFVQRHPSCQRQGSVPNGASLFLSAKPWCPCDHMFPKTWLKCRITVEQVWAPFGHSVLSMFRSKDFLTWTGVELQWGRARPGFLKQCHAEWGSRRLRGPLSGVLCAFYGWLSFMTPKNPFSVLFIADLKHQALLFLQTYNAYCMTELFFIFLLLSEPWNPVRKFLVQAFGGDTTTQVGHLGEIGKLLLQHGGWGQVSFQVVAERD